MQELNDETTPLELAMQPYVIYDEGRIAINELNSTQTIIASLIKDDSDRSQIDVIKAFETRVEKGERVSTESENNEKDKSVSL